MALNKIFCLLTYSLKNCKVIRKIGFKHFKYVGKNFPHMQESRDMAHTQWLQMHCQWWSMADITTHKSRMGRRRVFKFGGGIDHMIGNV